MTQSPEEVAAEIRKDIDGRRLWPDVLDEIERNIASAIRSAVEAEREACAKIASSAVSRADIVSAIRARKEAP